ncbi:MAG: hypothetical protein E7590_08505 [Ruminococcaceae bacterium]|nr:hypothetical protein [Oscillospiraceae bacterium]
MKKLIVWLCVLALLCSLLTFMGCKPDEQPESGEQNGDSTPKQEQTGDDDVVNKDNSQQDDTANDIF